LVLELALRWFTAVDSGEFCFFLQTVNIDHKFDLNFAYPMPTACVKQPLRNNAYQSHE
jgi:hypothetical protein